MCISYYAIVSLSACNSNINMQGFSSNCCTVTVLCNNLCAVANDELSARSCDGIVQSSKP